MSCSATFVAVVLFISHFCLGIAFTPAPVTKADILRRHAVLPRTASEPSIYFTRFNDTTWDNTNWIINTTVLTPGIFQSRMSSANGYMGISLAAAGPFFEYDIPVDGDNIEGWPLFTRRQAFATLSGFFDEQPTTKGTNYANLEALGGESVISGVPHWGGILVVLENGQVLNATVDPATISDFSSSLDIKRGLSTWQYTWAPNNSDNVFFKIQYTLFTNKLFVTQGISQLKITPSKDYNVSIVNILDGRCAVRTDFVDSGEDGKQIYTAVRPSGVQNVTAYLYATMNATSEVDMSTLTLISAEPYIGVNDSTVAQAAQAYLKADQTTTVTKFVGAATSDGFLDPEGLARNSSIEALATGYDQSLIYSAVEWRILMPSSSVDSYSLPNGSLPSDPYIVEAQIMAIVNPYYLLMNTVGADALTILNGAPIGRNSISVAGLTSDSYGGQVFWDAEVWMQPGLVVAFPHAAKQIANYRVALYPQALANIKTAYLSSQDGTNFSANAAVYPWTSGRYGNCTGDGPCFDYEYHINSDIVLEFVNYWVASGDTEFFREELFPIIGSVSALFSNLLKPNGSSWTLINMTDPDEYANNVNNGGFTMPAISNTLTYYNTFREMFGMERNSLYDEQAANVFIARDPVTGITLEYSGMNGSISVKQADVVLDIFPLSPFSPSPADPGSNSTPFTPSSPASHLPPYPLSSQLLDLDYYAAHQAASGPGMTFAIFSIVAAAISPSGCSSYTYQQYSTQPYARAPWFQLSEQLVDNYQANGGTHPAFPFLTGHGGANQVTVFGYLGLRLNPDGMLHLNPGLPPQIPYLRYRTIYWMGWPLSAESNSTHTTLTRSSTIPPYITANSTFATGPFPIVMDATTTEPAQYYQLPPNSTLVLPNRMQAYNLTVPGNLLQCRPVSSPDSWQPGQFPLSAVDGATSSTWVPKFLDGTASLTVNLSGLPFRPVQQLYFNWGMAPPANATVRFYNGTAEGEIVEVANITASTPYMASQADIIVPYVGNETTVNVSGMGIWSGQWVELQIWEGPDGGSVAEFAVVGGAA